MDRGAWWAAVHGVAELDTTNTFTYFPLSFIVLELEMYQMSLICLYVYKMFVMYLLLIRSKMLVRNLLPNMPCKNQIFQNKYNSEKSSSVLHVMSGLIENTYIFISTAFTLIMPEVFENSCYTSVSE